MIYFAQLETGAIKIGCTENLESRLTKLESYYGSPVALLATMPGDVERERQIHERFAHLRLGRREQFRPGPDLMEFIGKPILVCPNPDAVEAVQPEKAARPVRLDLSDHDHVRLERCARERGLSKASYARQAVLERIRADEGRN